MKIILTSICMAIGPFLFGCAQSKGIHRESHENFTCLSEILAITPIRVLYENPGIVNFSPLIIFGTAKFEIHPLAQPTLDSIANFLATTNTKYNVVVHSDKNGPRDRVFLLSEQRAKSIVAYLKMKGVSEQRLRPIGAGWKCFLGNNSNPEVQMKNRRVEFIQSNLDEKVDSGIYNH